MAKWTATKDSTGIWRSADGTKWNIHEEGAATLEMVELNVQQLWASFCKKQRSPCLEPNPWWGCEAMPPTHDEIKLAISEGRIQCARNDDDQHPGDRGWHIERVAYLAKFWNDYDPIRMKSGGMEIDDGAHRLTAAFYLQKKRILAYERSRG